MSSFLENHINDTKIKRKLFYNQIIFKKDNNNTNKDKVKRTGILKKNLQKNKLIKNKIVNDNNNSKSNIFQNNMNNSSFNLNKINNSNYENKIDSIEINKTSSHNIKYINLKSIFNTPRKSSTNTNFFNKISIKSKNESKINQTEKIKSYLLTKLKTKKPRSVKYHFSFNNIQRYNDFIKIAKINKENSFKLKYNNDINISKTSKNSFLKDKFGIYLYKSKYITNHFSFLKRSNTKKFINELRKKKSKTDISCYFNKLKTNLLEENKQMRKDIKSSYLTLENRQKVINSKILKINTPKEFRKIFFSFNKERAKKEKILTNLYINESKNPRAKIYDFGEKMENSKIVNENNIATLVQNKVNKLYHDLLIFKIPNLDEKIYIRKILYDVFIEFKNMLALSMMKNKNINIHKNGLDFDSFYNCNTKINQQGQTIAKRLFKIFNNKSDDKFISLENYVNGMLKIKNSDKEKKLNLFFDMIDENSKGYMTYDDIYKFGIISLQKITLNLETMDDFEKAKKDKNNLNVSVIETLADYFSRMIFDLVNIDIKENIPVSLLKKTIIQGGEQADYIEFLFGSINFV